jgi:hypothetical protein
MDKFLWRDERGLTAEKCGRCSVICEDLCIGGVARFLHIALCAPLSQELLAIKKATRRAAR